MKEVVRDLFKNESYRFQSTAILALQEASEYFLVDMFEQVNYMDIHGRDRDIKLWKRVHFF